MISDQVDDLIRPHLSMDCTLEPLTLRWSGHHSTRDHFNDPIVFRDHLSSTTSPATKHGSDNPSTEVIENVFDWHDRIDEDLLIVISLTIKHGSDNS